MRYVYADGRVSRRLIEGDVVELRVRGGQRLAGRKRPLTRRNARARFQFLAPAVAAHRAGLDVQVDVDARGNRTIIMRRAPRVEMWNGGLAFDVKLARELLAQWLAEGTVARPPAEGHERTQSPCPSH